MKRFTLNDLQRLNPIRKAENDVINLNRGPKEITLDAGGWVLTGTPEAITLAIQEFIKLGEISNGKTN